MLVDERDSCVIKRWRVFGDALAPEGRCRPIPDPQTIKLWRCIKRHRGGIPFKWPLRICAKWRKALSSGPVVVRPAAATSACRGTGGARPPCVVRVRDDADLIRRQKSLETFPSTRDRFGFLGIVVKMSDRARTSAPCAYSWQFHGFSLFKAQPK